MMSGGLLIMGGVSVCANELPLAQIGRQQTAFDAPALRNATKRMSDNRCTAGLALSTYNVTSTSRTFCSRILLLPSCSQRFPLVTLTIPILSLDWSADNITGNMRSLFLSRIYCLCQCWFHPQPVSNRNVHKQNDQC